MKGLSLKTFRLDLHMVEPDSESPVVTITDWEKKLAPAMDWINHWHGPSFDFVKKYYNLPLKALAGFSFDDLCKLHYSSVIMMDRTVTDLFDKSAQHEVIRKIQNCMWRWGFSKGTWNEIVDAYNNIRGFRFIDNPDFELRLDFTTGCNEFGYSKFKRMFIDGVFAFLVHYKGKHVMTIGFSIMHRRRILIQQVQLAQPKGNRWLFKFPHANRVEFVIDLFRKHFPRYRLYVIDGEALADKTLRDYRNALERKEKSRQSWGKDDPRFLNSLEQESQALREYIAHLEADKPRLGAFYRDVGRHKFGVTKVTVFHLPHYRVRINNRSRKSVAGFIFKSKLKPPHRGGFR